MIVAPVVILWLTRFVTAHSEMILTGHEEDRPSRSSSRRVASRVLSDGFTAFGRCRWYFRLQSATSSQRQVRTPRSIRPAT